MKFLCIGCDRLLDVERFRIDAGVLIVTCAQCGAENRAGAPSPAPAVAATPPLVAAPLAVPAPSPVDHAQAFDVPAGHCPKCISRRIPDALACPSCGLVFAQSPSEAFAPSEWLKGEWTSLLAEWSDDARHEALRAEAMTRAELAELGRLYRIRLAVQKQDPMAKRGLDEVLRLAVLPQLQLRQLKSQGPTEVPRWKYVLLSAVIVGCLVAMFILVRQLLTLS